MKCLGFGYKSTPKTEIQSNSLLIAPKVFKMTQKIDGPVGPIHVGRPISIGLPESSAKMNAKAMFVRFPLKWTPK